MTLRGVWIGDLEALKANPKHLESYEEEVCERCGVNALSDPCVRLRVRGGWEYLCIGCAEVVERCSECSQYRCVCPCPDCGAVRCRCP